MQRPLALGTRQGNFRNAPQPCLLAVQCGSSAAQCLQACGQWGVELVGCRATLPGDNGWWKSCNAPPHCPWVVGPPIRAIHRHIACELWAEEVLQCIAMLLGGSGLFDSRNAPPHCLWAPGSGFPTMHYQSASVQLEVIFLQRTTTLPWGSGRCNCCN